MQRPALITIIAMALVLGAGGFYAFTQSTTSDTRDAASKKTLGPENADAAYTDLDDEPFDFAAYEGRVRVVNAWASWTPFSATELPMLAELAREFDDDTVVFIAINRKEQNAVAQAFLETLEGADDLIFVQDPNDAFYRSIEGSAMPETVIFDNDGDIVFRARGPVTEKTLRTALTDVLNVDR